MIFPDYHLHSSFSDDSDANIKDIIQSAKHKGMTSICITDHYDMDFPVIKEAPEIRFDLDIPNYVNYLNELKNSNIKIITVPNSNNAPYVMVVNFVNKEKRKFLLP